MDNLLQIAWVTYVYHVDNLALIAWMAYSNKHVFCAGCAVTSISTKGVISVSIFAFMGWGYLGENAWITSARTCG